MSKRTLAAVDLGSNSFHMVVAEYQDGHLRMLDRIKEMVRLADGLDENDFLTDSAQDKALECLARFGERLNSFHPDDVAVVGTNTLRKANNSAEFLQRARKRLGHRIDIISGLEEARLVFLGATHSLAPSEDDRLIIDVGGGSTELALGKGYEADQVYSLFMGCVSLTRDCFSSGKITSDAIRDARLFADLELVPIVEPLKQRGWSEVIGTSGTARAIAKILSERHQSIFGVTASGITALIDELAAIGHTDSVPWTSIQERRKPVMIGGLIILERLFNALDIESMEISDYALREGVVYDMAGMRTGEDSRERSVMQLAQRYSIDLVQSRRLESEAQQIFDALADDWELPDDRGWNLLRWAAILHELGLSIAHSHYHRHGAYIVNHAHLPGFSRQLQLYLAWLIEGHRRRVPALPPLPLSSVWRQRLPRLLVILRLSAILVRTRADRDIATVVASSHADHLNLEFPAGWLDSHPLTRADLKAEVSKCEELGIGLTFA